MAGVELSVGDSGIVTVSEDSRQLTASPRLSRKTQDEVVVENETSSIENPDNYPLHSPWSFWFDRSHRGGDAGDFFANLRRLCTVTSIKAFWSVFNNLPTCEKLRERDSYHLMRSQERRPVWEDVDNVDGGMWIIKVAKHQTVLVWQELLLAAVGEQFSTSVHTEDEICGVSVRIRYDTDVIQIWNQNSELGPEATVIQRLTQLIPSLEIKSCFYQSNKDKMRDSLSRPLHVHHHHHHRGPSPPPPSLLASQQKRYTGSSHPMFPPPHPLLPLGYPAPRHGPTPSYAQPPPPTGAYYSQTRFRPPPSQPSPHPPYPHPQQ